MGQSLPSAVRLWATSLRARGPHPAGEYGGGAGPVGGACPGEGRGRPGKTEAPSRGVAAEPGCWSTTFSGAGLRETAGGKTRRPEAFAFFDARARDAAAVGRAPGEERPQAEPSESLLRPSPPSPGLGASVLLAALLVAMECPHLSSSVCIAPDSAKFPNGSPSSWCCSGECGPRRPCSAPEAPALPGLPSRGRGQSARGLGERCGQAGPGGWGGYAARRAERRRRLLCFPRPDGPSGEGEAREG